MVVSDPVEKRDDQNQVSSVQLHVAVPKWLSERDLQAGKRNSDTWLVRLFGWGARNAGGIKKGDMVAASGRPTSSDYAENGVPDLRLVLDCRNIVSVAPVEGGIKGSRGHAYVCLTGHVISDPYERKDPQTGVVTFMSFRVSVRRWLTAEEKATGKSDTDVWAAKISGNSAKFASGNVRKGDIVSVYGEPSTDSYTNREGVTVRGLEVTGRDLINTRYDPERAAAAKAMRAGNATQRRTTDTEIPF